MRKNFFYIHTNIVPKKLWEKTRETIFPETRIVRAKNVGKKIVGKKGEKTFFYIHTNIVTQKKGGGETRETNFPETHE